MVTTLEMDTFNEPFLVQPIESKFLYNYSQKWEEKYGKKHYNSKNFSIMLERLILHIRERKPLEGVKELYSRESILENLVKHPGADGRYIYQLKKSIMNVDKEELSKIIYSFVQNILWFQQIMKADLEKEKTRIFGVLCLLTDGINNKVQYYLGNKQTSICKILKIVLNIVVKSIYVIRVKPELKNLPKKEWMAVEGLIRMKTHS